MRRRSPNYLNGDEGMLKKVVNGPGIAWVDLQPEFTKSLLQTIGGGVGRLIDADMNEASTKSEAIQARSR
ncbi:flagellin [compost metagenome]